MVRYSTPPPSAPDPRLTARSMLSLGTELFLAFWMASYSVGLPPGSPPPMRAATSMFLISFANSLPRRASMTAFLCFVVAHLEGPDMLPSASPLCLPDRDDPTRGRSGADGADDLHVRTDGLHPGRPDEQRVERLVALGEPEVGLEGVDLPAERVAPD